MASAIEILREAAGEVSGKPNGIAFCVTDSGRESKRCAAMVKGDTPPSYR
jgi:hypothetical protein